LGLGDSGYTFVAMSNFKNPVPTVDCLVELSGGRLVFIKRRNPPLGWALPGGFVDEGEPLHHACVREVLEETGLDVELVEQFFTYSDPTRDARRHTISTVFIGRANGEPNGGDDAEEARAFPLDNLPAELVFDHATIVSDYVSFKRTGKRPGPRS
jgi:8-oxo-dGTP diphosphatase